MGKGGKKKKDPNAPIPVAEDSFQRARKLLDQKVAPKQPKGELTQEEWSIPPYVHHQSEFKQPIQYWKQCAIVYYSEKDMRVPSRLKTFDDEGTAKKMHPRKEVQDLWKYLRGQVKQANKRTGQFLKQLEKKEGKELKRQALSKQIQDLDRAMNEELRSARTFTDSQLLFDKKCMIGSKLGDKGPRKNALIVVEVSDKQQAWVEETKDEVSKLLNLVIEADSETFNVATFSTAGQNMWCPTYQNKSDPKKGLADALKWLGKNVSTKTCSAQPFPPDWVGMLRRFTGDGQPPPYRIFLCCSRAPEGSTEEILELMRELRELDPPAKGEPVIPINVVAFDPQIVGDDDEKAFFEQVAGVEGSFKVDTSAEDLVALDKMLKAVGVKKKQLDKLTKKLDKMEDQSERVAEDRALLQTQIALQRMLENDLEVCDFALKAEPPAPVLEI
mmetsp:Transcript_61416/g.132918  ORF Transcript_61416/g.132918 Transcript_61416/m.132918 type:complete len:443 (-) Transcript_61416:150-1478(-)